MSANTSTEQSHDANHSLDIQQMKRLRTAIKAASSKGKYETMIYETIRDINRDILISESYQIQHMGVRMGNKIHVIKWNTPLPPHTTLFNTTYYPGGIPTEHHPL